MPRVPSILPPLAPFRAPGATPSLSALDLGLQEQEVDGGLARIDFPQDEPLAFACDPSPLDQARLISVSPTAAALIGLNAQDIQNSSAWRRLLCGEAILSSVPSYASVYAGHQFGVFVPRLGDGRALNLGRLRGWELQLKGAGSTPYARGADGRAVLRSSVREYLCSEAMAALRVPTTRALSLVVSTTPVFRERVEPAAIVCRMAKSFARIGHVEYFASRGRADLVTRFLDGLIESESDFHEARSERGAARYEAFFWEVVGRTAELMAHWTAQGFMHGVMNTDNFSLLGLTLDYGPFGWMEGFRAHHVCNHSDHGGRYRFSQQPAVGLWNLSRLLASLGVTLDRSHQQRLEDELVARYESRFQGAFLALMASKLGLNDLLSDAEGREGLDALLDSLFPILHEQGIDYPRFFRALSKVSLLSDPASCDTASLERDWGVLLSECSDPQAWLPWLSQFRQLASRGLPIGEPGWPTLQSRWRAARLAVNPAFVLRNWVAEEIIRALEDEQDPTLLERACRVFASPFEDHIDASAWQAPPPQWAATLQVSCSS
ncbi:MAG: YdiU family protein [Betaproteobacteria bacterium]|nr:YdiU family protein [Betaproteobacteria bacterium]